MNYEFEWFAFIFFLTSSPLYCLRQCRSRLVLASQKDVISKSSLFFCKTVQMIYSINNLCAEYDSNLWLCITIFS